MGRATVMVLGVVLLPSALLAQEVSVIRADFVRERIDASGSTVRVESGHHFIATDGTYLMEKVSYGERVAEVWLPNSGERITINHTLRVAVRGPLDGRWPIPSVRGGVDYPSAPPPPAAPVPPPPLGTVSYPIEDLGQRSYGLFSATGTRQVLAAQNESEDTVIETWVWGNPSALKPVLMEISFTSASGVDAMRITAVRRMTVPLSLFDAPEGYNDHDYRQPFGR